MALGTGETTPLRMAEAYTVFANGGYKVSAHVIDKIYDSQGRLRAQMQPLVAGENAPQVIDPRNAYIMYRIMQDVVRYGTARGALSIGRSDIAGKTGTTNENKDAWFVGFNPSVVTAVYVGFDKPRSMGRAGYGGTIALPVWVDYMRFALKGTESKGMKVPEGIVAKGGEYYMKERLVTSPELTLDNSGSVPRPAVGRPRSPADEDGAPRRRSSGQADSSDNQGEVPVNPTNSGGNNKQLDSLF